MNDSIHYKEDNLKRIAVFKQYYFLYLILILHRQGYRELCADVISTSLLVVS